MNYKKLMGDTVLINIFLFVLLIPGNMAMVPIFIVSSVFIIQVFYIIYVENNKEEKDKNERKI